jgi:hypothetical protein
LLCIYNTVLVIEMILKSPYICTVIPCYSIHLFTGYEDNSKFIVSFACWKYFYWQWTVTLIEFNLVDQFFILVRIVVKTSLLLIFFLNITIKNFYLWLFNNHACRCMYVKTRKIETISLGIIVMISHQNYLNKISNWIFMCKIVILSAFNFI